MNTPLGSFWRSRTSDTVVEIYRVKPGYGQVTVRNNYNGALLSMTPSQLVRNYELITL